ncbi:MAG TPA: NUDIX hydrolase [Gammaproteobacteria bacterium]
MSHAKPWREIGSQQLLDCRIFQVYRSTAVSPHTGAAHDFAQIRSVDWVQVIPITAAGEVVMVRQYRAGSGTITLEIPGGLLDAGEDPAAAAARECLEETGYAAKTVQPMGAMNPNPALFTNRLHSFYALDVERVAGIKNEHTEHTEAVLVPLKELEELLRENRIDHALVAATLWRYLREHVPAKRGDAL